MPDWDNNATTNYAWVTFGDDGEGDAMSYYPMPQDCLQVRGLRCYGYTGALPEEQVIGQWFEVDLRLWVNLAPAAASDCLADTLDYGPLIAELQTLIQTARFKLVERLTDAIATQVLTHAQVHQVHVKLTKLSPPIPHFSGSIVVEMTRSRADVQS